MTEVLLLVTAYNSILASLSVEKTTQDWIEGSIFFSVDTDASNKNEEMNTDFSGRLWEMLNRTKKNRVQLALNCYRMGACKVKIFM